LRARKMPVTVLAVATLAGLVPVLRAADASAPATWLEPARVLAAPTDAPYGLGYSSTDPVGGTSDVFTANRTGGARRNLTDRAGLDEDGPAWSPDGGRLAYAEHQAGGGARIVVADAQGRGRRVVAPAGTRDSDVDRDPAWSPDGTRLAFARERDGQSSIVLVRVADEALLGVVPAPAGLNARDAQPAWSPEGTRLAFARNPSRRPPPTVDPDGVDRPARPGEQLTVDVAVTVPTVPARPDVVFLVDGTNGMQTALAQLRNQLPGVMMQIAQEQPDARFGLAAYRGSEDGVSYEVGSQLTTDRQAVSTALNGLTLSPPGDLDSHWINGLFQVATGMSFRSDGTPVIVLVGHKPSPEPSRGHRLSLPGGGDGDTLVALRDIRARVVGVEVEPFVPSPPPDIPELAPQRVGPLQVGGLDERGQATLVTGATGGVLVALGSGGTAVRDAVLTAGLHQLPVLVTPVMDSCDTGLSASVSPASRTVRDGGPARFTETVRVAADATAGATLRCRISYALGDGTSVGHDVAVRVSGGGPLVRVDDRQVETDDRAGAVVTYTATAEDANGDELEVTCRPPSGTRFPVGQTLVTCTATDDNGVSGSDTALITVVRPPDLDNDWHVWVATLLSPLPDVLAVSHQIDLTNLVRAPCHGDFDEEQDTAPAWSPDAAEIAFQTVNNLCVAAPDGTGARRPITEDLDGFPADPAFSPDGRLIAFAEEEVEGVGSDIRTVPAAGGTTTMVIDGPRHDGEPAFRILPTADLTLTVAVDPQPGYVGGDDLVVTFAVRNNSDRAMPAVTLTPRLPTRLPLAGAACPAGGCALGELAAGAEVTREFRLRPAVAVRSTASGTAVAAVGDGQTLTATASTPVEVIQPVLTISPVLGPPGFVAIASGANFPDAARVRLTWSAGITFRNNVVEVQPDGTFTWQALVFRKDVLGPRQLVAEWVPGSGPRFGPVSVGFLVVPRPLDPPEFEGRG